MRPFAPGPGRNAIAMQLVCLDLEGVLVPEIWIEVAKRTGIEALARTTRDEPDYDVLMRGRLELLARHRLKLADIQRVIDDMVPLEGAAGFLARLRERYQVVILSDTFYEFAGSLMRQLGRPMLLCHQLETDAEGFVSVYRLRMADQKRAAVRAFQGLNYKVIAAGDSFNDLAMLETADAGIFFRPPQAIAERFPRFPVTRSYPELESAIDAARARPG
jgi:phosphoserine/homoserine phosphotransferase